MDLTINPYILKRLILLISMSMILKKNMKIPTGSHQIILMMNSPSQLPECEPYLQQNFWLSMTINY
jgi:hypothetical protein